VTNANKRRNLRNWVLQYYGDGEHADCRECGDTLDYHTMTLDRYPIRGREGGTYARDNVRPLCRPCNHGDAFCITYTLGEPLERRCTNRQTV
jgi:hypothetical protein